MLLLRFDAHPFHLVQINQYVYIDKMINTSAFTYFSQIRVLNEETAYISPTSGEPCGPYTSERQ